MQLVPVHIIIIMDSIHHLYLNYKNHGFGAICVIIKDLRN